MLLSPTSTQYLVGTPVCTLERQSALLGIKIALTKKHPFGCLNIVLLKSQNFDAIKPHKYTVSCGGPVTFLGKFLRGRVLWRT